MVRSTLLVMCTVLAGTVTSSGRTWHVKPDSTGDAPNIQDALDSAAYYSSCLPSEQFGHVGVIL
jgi:hypothetical protein